MSDGMPLVTIAIPTFNRGGTYLPHALACALAQTYRNIEIIVSDNCSTDETPVLVTRNKDPRIRYYRHEKSLVPNDNFNFCLRQARGDYFLLLLDDEVIDHGFVATCMDRARSSPSSGLIRTGMRVVDANGGVLHEIPNRGEGLDLAELFLAWFSGKTTFYLCNTLFKTAVLASVGGFHSRHNLFQDVMAQVRVMTVSSRLDVLTVLASTRSHPDQFTYSAKAMAWAEDSLDLLTIIQSAVPQKKDEIAREGEKFFAAICYSRAGTVRPSWRKWRAYGMVYRRFGGRHYPPLRTVLQSTTMYRWLRGIKRHLKGQPQWAAAG